MSHRFTLASCERFLPVLETICRLQPNELEVGFGGLGIGTITCAARLRDAAIAYTTGKLVPPTELSKLPSIWPLYQVVEVDSRVLLRKRGHRVKPSAKASAIEATIPQSEIRAERPLTAVLHAILIMISERLIPRATIVIDREELDKAVQNYDVAIIANVDGSFTIC